MKNSCAVFRVLLFSTESLFVCLNFRCSYSQREKDRLAREQEAEKARVLKEKQRSEKEEKMRLEKEKNEARAKEKERLAAAVKNAANTSGSSELV